MSKRKKLFTRVKNSQKNIRFQDFCTLMEYFGFSLSRISGSHYLYQHPDVDDVINVQSTHKNLAKAYQVRQFLKLVDTYNLSLEGEEEDEEDE